MFCLPSSFQIIILDSSCLGRNSFHDLKVDGHMPNHFEHLKIKPDNWLIWTKTSCDIRENGSGRSRHPTSVIHIFNYKGLKMRESFILVFDPSRTVNVNTWMGRLNMMLILIFCGLRDILGPTQWSSTSHHFDSAVTPY